MEYPVLIKVNKNVNQRQIGRQIDQQTDKLLGDLSTSYETVFFVRVGLKIFSESHR